MPTYLALLRFTQKGVTEAEFSVERADNFKKSVVKAGGKVHELFWLMGHYDGAVLFDAPSETIASALMLSLAEHGCVHTETLRAFNAREFAEVLKKTK